MTISGLDTALLLGSLSMSCSAWSKYLPSIDGINELANQQAQSLGNLWVGYSTVTRQSVNELLGMVPVSKIQQCFTETKFLVVYELKWKKKKKKKKGK